MILLLSEKGKWELDSEEVDLVSVHGCVSHAMLIKEGKKKVCPAVIQKPHTPTQ